MKDKIKALLRRSPGITAALQGLSFSRRYQHIVPGDVPDVNGHLSDAWRDVEIPTRQRVAVDRDLEAYRAGEPNIVFDALVEILRHNVPQLDHKTLLEIGCSSGYYSDVLRHRGIGSEYRGCDFSTAFVAMARERHPSVLFDVEDATQLSYGDGAFDIVVSASCILHILDYERSIREASRVAREYVVFHRTPVTHLSGPTHYTKRTYGVEMLEIHFREQHLVRMFAAHGLQVIDINSHVCELRTGGDCLIHKTYLCRKTS